VSAAASGGPRPSGSDGRRELRQGAFASWLALATSGSTLVCCALPALLVTIGAGAALSGLVAVFPQIVWLSEHKGPIFGAAVAALAVSAAVQWKNRNAPCPLDPALAEACTRTRRWSARLTVFSAAMLALGVWFAFVAPMLLESN
jgi:hypothetical protein